MKKFNFDPTTKKLLTAMIIALSYTGGIFGNSKLYAVNALVKSSLKGNEGRADQLCAMFAKDGFCKCEVLLALTALSWLISSNNLINYVKYLQKQQTSKK